MMYDRHVAQTTNRWNTTLRSCQFLWTTNGKLSGQAHQSNRDTQRMTIGVPIRYNYREQLRSFEGGARPVGTKEKTFEINNCRLKSYSIFSGHTSE